MSAEDESTLVRTYLRWRTPLLRLLSRKLGCRDDAEDLVQESFTRWMAQGGARQIAKPQTYVDANGKNLDPAYGHNYELGIKGAFLDKRLNASLALFLTNQKNVAEYVDYNPGALNQPTVGGGLRWQSKTENLGYWVDESRSIVQKPYAVADLMARYDITPMMPLTLNVNNVFDKRYFRTMGFNNSVYYGDGRTAALTLRALFWRRKTPRRVRVGGKRGPAAGEGRTPRARQGAAAAG